MEKLTMNYLGFRVIPSPKWFGVKILLVHNYEINQGGVSILNYDLAEFLSLKDWQVTIFSLLAKNHQLETNFTLEWKFRNLENLVFESDAVLINLSPYLWKSYLKTIEFCQRYNKNFIVWFHIVLDGDVYRKRYGLKDFKERENKLREIFNNHLCSKIICVSETVKNYLKDLVDDKDKLIVIYPGIKKINHHLKTDISGDILYVGRLSEEKNIELLIKSIKDIKDCNLNIVGSGPEKENLEKLASELNLIKRVNFYPNFGREKIYNLYRSHKLLCLPSKIESFGLVLVEAIYNDLPVVVSKNYGALEILRDFDYELFFEPNNEKELKSKIEFALKNYGYCKNKIRKIKTVLEKRFNFEKQMNKIEKTILESILFKKETEIYIASNLSPLFN
ncbi:MAG: hypothetical protein KatS3mg096_314 [Candidatus Parcubacteria bacterium]|nr:MAG: hypothetical protein KatS3mg096_314 [Candidatus Parcubacteria bacterium]